MSYQENKNRSRLSHEDQLVIEQMNEIVWNRVTALTPEWSQDYLNRFRAMSVGLNTAESYDLDLYLSAHVAGLQREGLIPDFFALRNEARGQLKLPPIAVESNGA